MGHFVVVAGPMGSGKTRSLIKKYKGSRSRGKHVLAIRPALDNRHLMNKIVDEHLGSVPAVMLGSIDGLMEKHMRGIEELYIDGLQFFQDEESIERIIELLAEGVDIYAYGLDLNSDGEAFGLMGEYLALADEVIKLKGFCTECGGSARFSVCTVSKDDEIHLPVNDYKTLCAKCYEEFIYSVTTEFVDMIANYPKRDHHNLKNVKILDNGMYEVVLGGDDFGFNLTMLITDETLDAVGWTLEELADIIHEEAAYRFIEELEAYQSGE